MGLRFPVLDAPAPPRQGRRSDTVSGSVVSVDDTTMTAQVEVAGSVVTARVGQQVKSAQAGDHVRVDWQGGTAAISAVVTAHAPDTYSFSGVTPGTLAANTAAPAAVSGTVPTVSGTITDLTTAIPAALSGAPSSYDQAWANTIVSRWLSLRGYLSNLGAMVVQIQDILGADAASGVRGQAGTLRTVTTNVLTATNTQSTALEEHRKVMATLAKQTLARERIAK